MEKSNTHLLASLFQKANELQYLKNYFGNHLSYQKYFNDNFIVNKTSKY